MRKDELHLEIITPEKVVYDRDVSLIQVPGVSGTFTLLKGHAPIISALGKGWIRVIGKNGVEEIFDCEGGVLECQDNEVNILVSKAEKAES